MGHDEINEEPPEDYISEFEQRRELFNQIRDYHDTNLGPSCSSFDHASVAVLMILPSERLSDLLQITKSREATFAADMVASTLFTKSGAPSRPFWQGETLHVEDSTPDVRHPRLLWRRSILSKTTATRAESKRERILSPTPIEPSSPSIMYPLSFVQSAEAPEKVSLVIKRLRLHWMKKATIKPTDQVLQEDLDEALAQAGISRNEGWGAQPLWRSSGIPLITGQVFAIKALDPEDLPSFELLELSWTFLRVASMCGGGTEEDLDSNGDTADGNSRYCHAWLASDASAGAGEDIKEDF
ncbi:unnamed protein product [Parascedosporium putredinis]|uniref:HNH nuclease domain-containing protein n=1 Tax=Parascedosporium putredinis TaxID=1442378 RepID=A0A9P1GZ26_9PEZI|nr:unnamed protein product [Parascedosporium putredinis]CAI7992405.1 unnamed protein product [Parascedosporium putredinis]